MDAYKDFWADKDMFDISDYPENSPYYCSTNKKTTGKFKDEACGIPITEFVGLKWAGVICRLWVSWLWLQVSGSAGKFILRGKTSTIAHAQSPNRERAKNCE